VLSALYSELIEEAVRVKRVVFYPPEFEHRSFRSVLDVLAVMAEHAPHPPGRPFLHAMLSGIDAVDLGKKLAEVLQLAATEPLGRLVFGPACC
jgi:hypothetical protein